MGSYGGVEAGRPADEEEGEEEGMGLERARQVLRLEAKRAAEKVNTVDDDC